MFPVKMVFYFKADSLTFKVIAIFIEKYVTNILHLILKTISSKNLDQIYQQFILFFLKGNGIRSKQNSRFYFTRAVKSPWNYSQIWASSNRRSNSRTHISIQVCKKDFVISFNYLFAKKNNIFLILALK